MHSYMKNFWKISIMQRFRFWMKDSTEEVSGRILLLLQVQKSEQKLVGKGFVARLSGSTVEFMSMWKTMMFGRRPFTYDGETLKLTFAPVIPGYLVGKDLKVSAMFFGAKIKGGIPLKRAA